MSCIKKRGCYDLPYGRTQGNKMEKGEDIITKKVEGIFKKKGGGRGRGEGSEKIPFILEIN